jgi:hypothetical protein
MFRLTILLICAAGVLGVAMTDSAPRTMPLPENYREWVWLSSGLGMSYSAAAGADNHPSFDNVFASPEAFKVFKATATWPDRTVLMLEGRNSQSKSSINQSGHYQTDRVHLEAHVKDDRIPGKWAFYSFGNGNRTGTLIPRDADCYACHEQHAAVDTTFVQFYPTLLEIAKSKGKVKP